MGLPLADGTGIRLEEGAGIGHIKKLGDTLLNEQLDENCGILSVEARVGMLYGDHGLMSFDSVRFQLDDPSKITNQLR